MDPFMMVLLQLMDWASHFRFNLTTLIIGHSILFNCCYSCSTSDCALNGSGYNDITSGGQLRRLLRTSGDLHFEEKAVEKAATRAVAVTVGAEEEGRSPNGPKFIIEPQNRVDFSNGTYERIDCVVSGWPTPSIHWAYANGTIAIDLHNQRRAFKNGTIIFWPFRGDDYRTHIHAAPYKCIAHNVIGTIISRTVHVRAVVNQYYDVQVHDEFVILGNTAVFKCHIPSFVKDYVKVTSWLREERSKNGVNSSPSRLASGGRYVFTPAGELHVLSVDNKDGAVSFTCETRHRLTGLVKISSPGKIIVTEVHNSVTPRIAHSLPVVHTLEGETVQLSCEAQGFPVPTHRWYRVRDKETQPIASNERVREMFSFLSIQGAQLSDEGLYRCVVTNSVGEERTDTVLRVRARLAVEVQPEMQTIDVGSAITLTCSTTGHPVPSVTWLYNGLPVVFNSHRKLITPWILRIENAGKEDRGMYQCLARNGDDEAQASVEIKLGDVVPVLESKFKEMTVQPGSTLNLECSASGQPSPRFQWTLDGSPLPTRDQRYRLMDIVDDRGRLTSQVNITGVQVTDSGQFICSAINKAGQTSHSAKIHVTGRPMIRPMPNMSAVAGTTAQIICRVLGYPIQTITWEMDGALLPTNRRHQVLDNGTLFIHDVSKALDEGVYKCVARSPQGETASRTITITVMVPPLIDPFTFPRLLYEGMRARVSCVVTKGDLPIIFNWLKDDSEIDADLDVTVRQDDHFSSSITFPSITPFHSGNYSCIARNAASIVNYTATLVVNVPPRWLIQPSDQSAAFQSNVLFNCRADGTPTTKITWKKSFGERRGPEDYRDVTMSSSNARVLVNDSLLLERVSEQDEGYYLCEALNGVGTGLSKVVYLTVHAGAYFETKMTTQNSRRGHSAHLSCVAQGDLPIVISWTSNGLSIDASQNPRFSIRERKRTNAVESELIVAKVQRSDSGQFKCVASNAYGRDETTVTLVVQEPPDVPDKLRVIDHGSRTVQLNWMPPYDGNSQLLGYLIQYKLTTDDWQNGSQNVTIDALNSRTTVHGLLPGVSYNLRAIARNAIGHGDPSNSVAITTNEEAPSGAPLQVDAVAQGPQSLKVTWKPPRNEFRNGAIVGFYVGYKIYDSSELYSYETVTVSDRNSLSELILKSLKKYTKYSITVKAFNAIGTGPSSDEIVAFTSEDVPSEAPQNVHCSSPGTQSVQVRWDPPPPESQNGILKGYKIFFTPFLVKTNRLTSKPEAKFVVISAKSQETSLTGLEKYTNYSIQVAALTQVGDGIPSKSQFCRTREDVPSSPNDVKALISSSTSVLITWKPPKKPNGILAKYNVYWSPTAKDSHKRAIKVTVGLSGWSNGFNDKPLTYDVQGLIENERYDFWVTASTNVGEGESTAVLSQTPHHKVPARVASFPETTTIPFKSNALLPCLSVGSPSPRRTWQLRGRKIPTDDRFQYLDNGTLLIVGVQRHDVGNYSCRIDNIFGSDEVIHELLVLAPPLAPHLLVHKTTQSSIVLTWKPRDETGHPVLAYRLKYKRDFGGWEEMSVNPTDDHVILKNLHCGTRYQIYLQAENNIGAGEASKMITVATKGSIPRIPAQVGVLRVNVTSVTLRLVNWPDGGCPVRHFVVQYRPKDFDLYTLVSNNVIPEHESITIGDLKAGVPYVLHITAHNDAGSVAGEYEFSTHSVYGELAADEEAKLSRSTVVVGFEASVLVAVVVPTLLIIIVSIVVCLLLRRKKYRRYQQSSAGTNHHQNYQDDQVEPEMPDIKRQLQTVTANHTDFNHPSDIETPTYRRTSANKRTNIIHDDVCPYATFNLSRGRPITIEDPSMNVEHFNLRTFDSMEDEAAMNQHSVAHNYLHGINNRQLSQRLIREQYLCQTASSPSKTSIQMPGTERYVRSSSSSSTDEIHKLKMTYGDDDGVDQNDIPFDDVICTSNQDLSLDSVHATSYDDIIIVDNADHRQHQRRILFPGRLIDSHDPELACLTESAVHLFEQTRVPDLLFHEHEHDDDRVESNNSNWHVEDHDSDQNFVDPPSTANMKIYSDSNGLKLQKKYTSSRRPTLNGGYQLYGIVR